MCGNFLGQRTAWRGRGRSQGISATFSASGSALTFDRVACFFSTPGERPPSGPTVERGPLCPSCPRRSSCGSRSAENRPQVVRKKRLATPEDSVFRCGRIPATGCKI